MADRCAHSRRRSLAALRIEDDRKLAIVHRIA
jgi:hypothetical protein